jgi:hypothetical protein
MLTDFERTIERATGRSIDEIRETPLSESRVEQERRAGRPTELVSYSGPRLVSHEECNRACDEAIRVKVSERVDYFLSRAYAGIKRLFG